MVTLAGHDITLDSGHPRDNNNHNVPGIWKKRESLKALKVHDAYFFRCVTIAIEFLGTFLFLFLAFGGTQGLKPSIHDQFSPVFRLYLSFVFGITFIASVWTFCRFTGAQLNPAVTVGLVVVGAVKPLIGVLIIISQLAGGLAAAALTSLLLPGEFDVGVSKALDISIIGGLVIETILTFQMMLTILMVSDGHFCPDRCALLTILPIRFS